MPQYLAVYGCLTVDLIQLEMYSKLLQSSPSDQRTWSYCSPADKKRFRLTCQKWICQLRTTSLANLDEQQNPPNQFRAPTTSKVMLNGHDENNEDHTWLKILQARVMQKHMQQPDRQMVANTLAENPILSLNSALTGNSSCWALSCWKTRNVLSSRPGAV